MKDKRKKTLVTQVLGTLPVSSHPIHYPRRRWVYIAFGVSPFAFSILAIVLYLLWGLLGVGSVEDVLHIVENVWLWIQKSAFVLTGLFVFAIGFSVSGLLTVLAGRYRTLVDTKELKQKNYWPIWVLVSTATLIGIAGSFFILRTESPRVDFFISMLLIGPILISILILGPVLDYINGYKMRSTKVFLWLVGVLASIYIAALFSGLVRAGTDSLHSFLIKIDDPIWDQFSFLPPKDKLFESLDDLVRNIFIVLNMLMLTSWLMWQKPSSDKEADKTEKKPKKGIVARIFSKVKKFFGIGKGEDASLKDAPQEWFNALLETKLDGCIKQTSPDEIPSDKREFSTSCEGSDYCALFAGVIPTEDQDRCLRTLLTRRNRDFSNLCQSSSRPSNGDMLIQGAVGSGRTTWLAAAAISSVILRGDKVLVLCSDQTKANDVARGIKNVLENSRVKEIVLVSRFNMGLLKAIEANDLAALPDVLVATSDEIEHGFFKDASGASEVKKAALRMLDTVFVTDIMDSRLTPQNRLMLPFLLGKIRLINEVARGTIQLVVFIPDTLDKAIQNEVGNRLLSPIRKWIPEMLRPWRTATDKVVNVELAPSVGDVSSLDRATASISRFLLEKNQHVVILRRSFSPEQLEKLHADLLPNNIEADHLMVVSSLESLRVNTTSEDEEKRDWCIVVNHVSHNASSRHLSVPLIRNAEQTAVINLGLAENIQPAKLAQFTIPVLGSSKSQGILVRELAKAVPYLEIGASVHRNIWRQFGIPESGGIHKIQDGEILISGFGFLIDPPENVDGITNAGDVNNYNHVFPWIQLNRYAGHHAEVESVNESAALYHLRLKSNTDLVVTKRKLKSDEKQRVAEWFVEGQVLDNSSLDLAQADVIALDDHDEKWIPKIIVKDPRNHTRIEGLGTKENDNEAYLPKWQGDILIPKEATVVPAAGLPKGIRWCQFRDEIQIKSIPIQAVWELNGHFSESGNLISIAPVSFKYEAIASLLVLGSGKDVRDQNHNFSGTWTIDGKEGGHEFWPEMTAALMAALIGCAPDAARLGRILAFRSKDEPNKVAHVLIVELPELSGTLDEIFRLIFNSDVMRKQFFANALEVLRRVSHVKDDPDGCFKSLALPARQSMGKFNKPLDCDEAIEILNSVSADAGSENDISLR